jgi:hypothetical protein
MLQQERISPFQKTTHYAAILDRKAIMVKSRQFARTRRTILLILLCHLSFEVFAFSPLLLKTHNRAPTASWTVLCTPESKESQESLHFRVNRRSFAQVFASVVTGISTGLLKQEKASAAPPFAIIAEELGYFPVTNSKGETVNVPKRINRASSEQALKLATALKEKGAVVYTAYWCPHCARQKELFGREAWHQLIPNVECAPKGYNSQSNLCFAKHVDGYPTWVVGGKDISGERPLADIAKAIGFSGFREELEENLPPPLGSSSCK